MIVRPINKTYIVPSVLMQYTAVTENFTLNSFCHIVQHENKVM